MYKTKYLSNRTKVAEKRANEIINDAKEKAEFILHEAEYKADKYFAFYKTLIIEFLKKEINNLENSDYKLPEQFNLVVE